MHANKNTQQAHNSNTSANNNGDDDALIIDSIKLSSRLLLGTAGYPSPATLAESIKIANPGLITVSIRRENSAGKGQKFWDLIKKTNVPVLPNTAGCFSAQEAVTTAEMARELFETHWIKLEVIADDYTLKPEPNGLKKATQQLVQKGFNVFAYMNDDPLLAKELEELGCTVLMPWAAPIGTGQGLNNPSALKSIRTNHINKPLVIDAGIGAPSHAAYAMELGYDAVLLNTAVAKAKDPISMANAFSQAIIAGRKAYHSGLITPQEQAQASTPEIDKPFWHQNHA